MVNIKADGGNIQVMIQGQSINIQAEIIESFITLAENMATVKNISFDSAALLIYQLGTASLHKFEADRKRRNTCTEKQKGNTSGESDTSEAKEKLSQ